MANFQISYKSLVSIYKYYNLSSYKDGKLPYENARKVTNFHKYNRN